MNNNNDINNNINIQSQEIGIDCNIVDNNNLNEHEISNYNYNNNNIMNNINQYINNENINQNLEEEEDEEEEENEEESNDDNNNNLIPKENFSQQVDFLFHPDNPEYLPPKKYLKKTIKKSKSSINSKKNVKNKKSKSKNKNKNKKNKKNNKNNKIINRIRPEFNLCTKIDPKPKTESLFYGPKDETKCEKQLRERAQKIAEYEENYWRQKEIYKAKRKKEEEELKNRYNYIKSRTSNNFYHNNPNQKEKINNEFINQFKNISKIEYPNTDIRNYECNPQKYDAIIHSLLREISEIKLQRKKENEQFVNQIKQLQNDLDDNKNKKKIIKTRPKSGNTPNIT
jgi:hypothetical protein